MCDAFARVSYERVVEFEVYVAVVFCFGGVYEYVFIVVFEVV